jgi:signal transduction histidine kinase
MERNPVVLIVDDTVGGRKALESLLIGQGYTLLMADGGEQALVQAAESKPDVILLDVMMPGMDGFDVCRRLRADPELAEVPVMFVTALDDSEARLTGIEVGADDFITKPFDRAELRARVRNIIRLNRYHVLLEEREKLQQLSQQILEIQERERRDIAIELHDEIGQGLTGLKHLIQHVQEAPADPESVSRLEDAVNAIASLISKVRDLSLNLRPSMLDDLGLYPALTWLVEQFTRKTGLRVVTNFSGAEERRFSPIIETSIFRIAQEGLTNIARHSQARQVNLQLVENHSTLVLQVRDNGVGFDQNRLRDVKYFSSGLSSMQERARIAGGKFQIDAAVNSGTMITVTIPLEKEIAQ